MNSKKPLLDKNNLSNIAHLKEAKQQKQQTLEQELNLLKQELEHLNSMADELSSRMMENRAKKNIYIKQFYAGMVNSRSDYKDIQAFEIKLAKFDAQLNKFNQEQDEINNKINEVIAKQTTVQQQIKELQIKLEKFNYLQKIKIG